jgi:benzoate-CoA ligase
MNAAESILRPALAGGLSDRAALLSEGRAVSYAQVRDAAARCANALRTLELPRGGRVLLLLRDSPALVAAHLGTMAAGGVAVTLSLRVSPSELGAAIADSHCSLVLVDAPLFPRFSSVLGPAGDPPRVYAVNGAVTGLPSWEATCAAVPADFAPVDLPPAAMAFWIYTSGTTGELKACVHRHESVLPAGDYLRETLGIGAGMRLYATSKLFFAYALGTCLFGSLQLGATTILAPEWPTPESVARIVESGRPDAVFSVPAMYRALLRSGAARDPAFRRVRHWICAGEKLSQPLYDRWRAAVGAAIVEGMGTSETIYMILTNRPSEPAGGSAGFPAPGVTAELRDEAGRRVTEPGAPGVLWVRMASTAREYWHRPALTRAAMRDGWFVTGDVFVVDAAGRWRHQGREEERFQAGDSWLNPADVEAELVELDGILDAAAVAERTGGAAALAIYVVAAPGTAREQVAAAVRAGLARHWPGLAAAASVRVVPELPRTASGKVQRHRLKELAAVAEQGEPSTLPGETS